MIYDDLMTYRDLDLFLKKHPEFSYIDKFYGPLEDALDAERKFKEYLEAKEEKIFLSLGDYRLLKGIFRKVFGRFPAAKEHRDFYEPLRDYESLKDYSEKFKHQQEKIKGINI